MIPSAIDPVETGLVASLSHPGGNITGGAIQSGVLSTKKLEITKELLPRLSMVAVLWDGANPALTFTWKQLQLAADTLSVKVQPRQVQGATDIQASMVDMGRQPPDALIVLLDALVARHKSEIIDFTIRQRLPAVFGARDWVDDGGLMSYGENHLEMFRRGAVFVDRILKGASPADLPVEQFTTFELVVNNRTAKAMGLDLPRAILARADEVIE